MTLLVAVLLAQNLGTATGGSLSPTAPLQLLDESVKKGAVSELNFAGAGVSCARTANRGTCTIAGGAGGGGGGAPTDAEFVTFSSNATLTNERVLTAGTNTTVDTATAGQVKVSLAGVVPAANGGLGAVQPTCGAGQFLTCNGAVCSCDTPVSGGGGSSNVVEASLALSGAGYFSTTVTGQAWVTTSSVIVCAPFATSADGLTSEAVAVAGLSVSASDRIAGTGFTLRVFSPFGLSGTVRFHCTGV